MSDEKPQKDRFPIIEIPKLKVYLDTSIINFLYAYDAPGYKKETEHFFETVLAPEKVEGYISVAVTGEINGTKDGKKRDRLLETFNKYPMIKTLVTTTDEQAKNVLSLAEAYLNAKIIPPSKPVDALHIAYTTLFQMDILLSWNFKHLANVNKEQKILILNKIYGYDYQFRMVNPMEVTFDDESNE
ncbi:hypothetical protein [Leadbettera azotonutricia]|uniref:PilT protein domain protein n=1 Tax=Leadbettera azotonutricia (strain ATCC BAA-888 / DSM 13862 / ZAS-9) TaxID=545695 RepID=F5YGE7_LEAAZ|nr:hypothetical protein [Leadbettera azotonutricia]AEF83198.1 PilT protein domain protein [Leadbettera azotonutricia ZAS-9]